MNSIIKKYLEALGYPVGEDGVGDKLALVAITTFIVFVLGLLALLFAWGVVATNGWLLVIPAVGLIVWYLLERAMKDEA